MSTPAGEKQKERTGEKRKREEGVRGARARINEERWSLTM
jgi:hypothetical protein